MATSRGAGGCRARPRRRTARSGGASSSVSEWLPIASPKTKAAATSQRSARACRSGAGSRARSSQPTSRHSRTADDREVERMGLGVRADRPGAGARPSPSPARTPSAVERVRVRARIDGRAGRRPEADRRQEVHPERRVAERLQDDRGEPGEDHPGREAGRVGRAQQRADGLVFGRVPVPEARHERQAGRREHDDPTAIGRDGGHEAAQDGHHPRSAPRPRPRR